MWSNDPKQLAAKLRKAAGEMRAEDQNGWPVLCDAVADYLEAAPSPSPAPGVVEAVWIVGASVGEYSDRTDWTVGVWLNETDAQDFIRQIDALGRVAIRAESSRWDGDDCGAYEKAEARCREADPGWSSYCGDAPIYSCWQEKIRPASLSQPAKGAKSIVDENGNTGWIVP